MVMIPKTVKELRDYLSTYGTDYDDCKIFIELSDDSERYISLVMTGSKQSPVQTIAYLNNFSIYDWGGRLPVDKSGG